MHVGPEHVFGIMVKPDEYGAGDLMHGRGTNKYLRGKEHQRGVVAALRMQLKKANFQNFDNLLSAFRFFDKVRYKNHKNINTALITDINTTRC